MIILPYRSEAWVERAPVVCWTIIALNVLVGMATFGSFLGRPSMDLIRAWGLVPAEAAPLTAVTSAFLHAGIVHLFGNMLLLGIFGPAVESRLGRWRMAGAYLLCVLGGSVLFVVANAGSMTPAIGASGAVMGVMALHLCIAPEADVRFAWYFFYRFGTFSVTAFWAVAWYLGKDVAIALAGWSTGVAHTAHVGGAAVGIAFFFVCRRVGWLPPDLGILARETRDEGSGLVPPSRPEPADRPERGVSSARARLEEALRREDDLEAFRAYESLQAEDPSFCLSGRLQLRLADLLELDERPDRAAEVLERYVEAHRGDPGLADVHLRLGLLYARSLDMVPAARAFLRRAARGHPDAEGRRRAERELASLEHRMMGGGRGA